MSKSRNRVQNTLNPKAFWKVNKKMTLKVGLEAACLLADLISKELYFDERKMLDKDGGFFTDSMTDLEKQMNITRGRRRKCLDKLIEVKFVSIKKKGVPARYWFYLNFINIDEYLSSEPVSSEVGNNPTGEVEKHPTKEVQTDRTINKNNNKNNNKNKSKPDKKSDLNLTNEIKDIFDKGYKELNNCKLSWIGKQSIYGKNIKEIIKAGTEQAREENVNGYTNERILEIIKAKAKAYYILVKNDKWHASQGFTYTAFMSSWNKLIVKTNNIIDPLAGLDQDEIDRWNKQVAEQEKNAADFYKGFAN